VRAVDFDGLDDEVRRCAVLVNATPIGMQGEPPPFDVAALDGRSLVYDTVYHPVDTPLVLAARERDVPAVSGIGMLVHQAAVSFELFTGHAAPLDAMRAAAVDG
jgi:shikimate dehydrogenase